MTATCCGAAAAPSQDANEADDEYSSRLDEWVATVVDGVALEITVQAVQLLKPEARPDEAKAPVTLFLSHAKKDLDPGQADPVRMVEEDIKELPIKHWMDSAEIPPGDKFETQISAGLRDCAIVVVFLTDNYASRPWCQREILNAKSLGVPILVVDALVNGEPRSFPYLGNLPTIHWPMGATLERQNQVTRLIVGRAMGETLRLMLNRLKLQAFADPDEIVLASAPEAISLAWDESDSDTPQRFIYPDPPVAKQELGILNGLRANATFVTPLTKLANAGLPKGISAVAVSISESGDLARHGISQKQEGVLVDEIHLYLLVAGLQIAYGGGLSGNFDRASNFTLRLFGLVEGYSEVALRAGSEGLRPIINYPPWPLHIGYTDREYDLFGSTAELEEGSRPSDQEVPESDDELFPPVEKGWRLLPTNPPQRLAWTRGLTLMRKQVTEGVQARVVIGGKMANYFGLYPGVVEEAWVSILAKQPLYLVGAFGGASRAVIDALAGDSSELLESCAAVAQLDEVLELAKARGAQLVAADQPVSLDDVGKPDKLILGERVAADLVEAGKAGPAAALNNGLSDEQNQQLFRSHRPGEYCRADPARV